ncbi:hypothetical protein GH714_024523 [Hevea brasiliensis]|uniref:Uncharacterized protein n=1 Tax=Hevea brasiliensis TaxID=3981 RepID=A0A6A6M2K9_HEVBR|nr:hypothetical protein GH714_024523 [Hevea brasiliensis]
MHMEFRHFYGSEESDSPQWMKWEELELLPSFLREMAIGQDGSELGGWMPLYSSVDVKDCLQKVQKLKYAEAACHNGALLLEQIPISLESSAVKVPIYVISSVAAELLAFTNIIPEWLSKLRQEKDGLDADMALLPFKPIAMKVLHCSFLSGIWMTKAQPLLKILQPKIVMMGISGSIEQGLNDAESDSVGIIQIHGPNKALIEVRATRTVITAPDENLAALIFEAISTLLDGI